MQNKSKLFNKVSPMFTTTLRNSVHFHFLYLVSQHVSAYVEAIFKCGFLSDNTILKKLPLLNGSIDSTALHSVHFLLFSILVRTHTGGKDQQMLDTKRGHNADIISEKHIYKHMKTATKGKMAKEQ
jgi:hypothetical protein